MKRHALFIGLLALVLFCLSGVQMTASLLQRDTVSVELSSITRSTLRQKQHALEVLNDLEKQTGHTRFVGTTLHEVERERRKLQREIENLQQQESLHSAAPLPEQSAGTIVEDLTSLRFSDQLSLHKAKRLLQRMAFRAGLQFTGGDSAFTAEKILALKQQDSTLKKRQTSLEVDLERNQSRVKASTQQLAAARQMLRQVQDTMFALREQLTRLDAQIARRQERLRIERGELDPQRNKYEEAKGSAVEFVWPARARVTAGFHDEQYQTFFGIPHNGIDIAVPQHTQVYSAADGVVFSVRDGGMGFSYVLIAHRDGFATLYGHLSSFAVEEGDEVDAGQLIGLSGGAPGTPGAGLITTGAHLHFEMTKNGVNIDPMTQLQEQ